jgi:hypothetical protein
MGLTTCHKGSETEETVNEEGERLILAKVVFGEDGFCSNDIVSFFWLCMQLWLLIGQILSWSRFRNQTDHESLCSRSLFSKKHCIAFTSFSYIFVTIYKLFALTIFEDLCLMNKKRIS